MQRHISIIKLGFSLGYFCHDDLAGVCHGMSMAWAEACILGEETKFNQRIKKITSFDDVDVLIGKIRHIQNVVRVGQIITPQDADMLEILSFLEKVALYQSPTRYCAIFGETLHQSHEEKTSQVASSEDILSEGGLVTLTTYCGALTLQDFKEILELKLVINKPLSIQFTLFNTKFGGHSLALFYELSEAGPAWRYFDINNEDSNLYTFQEIDFLLADIIQKYYSSSTTDVAIRIRAITTQSHALELERVVNFSAVHRSTKDTERLLLVIAFISDDLAFIDECCPEQIKQFMEKTGGCFFTQTVWNHLVFKGHVTKEEIFEYPLAFIYALDAVIDVFSSLSSEDLSEILAESQIFDRLFGCMYHKFITTEYLDMFIPLMLKCMPEKIRVDILYNSSLLEYIVRDYPMMIKSILLVLGSDARSFMLYLAAKIAINSGKSGSLAAVLDLIPQEQRYAFILRKDINKTRLLHSAVRYHECLNIIFEMIPESQHIGLINQFSKIDRYNNCNLLHAAIFYKTLESLELLLSHLPVELLHQKIVSEVASEPLGSVWSMVNSSYYYEFKSPISDVLLLNSAAHDSARTRNSFFTSVEEEQQPSGDRVTLSRHE